MDIIFLVGMPACGKSYLGNILASEFGSIFYDTDQYLQKIHNCTIASLFEQYGEPWFRNQETIALTQILSTHADDSVVISTGGGLPLYNQNMDLMLKNGLVIWVNVPMEVLAGRILARRHHRPMFAGLDTSEQIIRRLDTLWDERKNCYQRANIQVTGSKPLEAIDQIHNWKKERNSNNLIL